MPKSIRVTGHSSKFAPTLYSSTTKAKSPKQFALKVEEQDNPIDTALEREGCRCFLS